MVALLFQIEIYIKFYIFHNLTDQPVPSGLHYRINLETGKKEAKLLDDSKYEDRKTEESIENSNCDEFT